MGLTKKSYMQATPRNWRKLGDALLAVGSTITAAAIAEEIKIVAYIALFISVVGKFLTNFFTEK